MAVAAVAHGSAARLAVAETGAIVAADLLRAARAPARVRRSTLEIDLAAVHANAQRLIEAAAGSLLWAVVKADGYGHGAVECAGTALSAGAERVCCATLEEASELREGLGQDVPIVVLSPLRPGEETEAGGLRDRRLVAGGLRQAERGRRRLRRPRQGRHRDGPLGNGPGRCARPWVARWPVEAARYDWPGVMSHLATADDDPAFAAVQTAVFAELAREFPPCPRHLANSAAALTLADTHFDAVRCGIALYGVSPFDRDPSEHGLRPALRWTSRVAGVRDLGPGQSAGYGRRLIATDAQRVASVPVGYADGYPRLASGRADVLVRGRRRPVAATVSMDQLTCVVDGDVQLGDEVVLIGAQGDERITAEELAGHAETIGYEIVCGDRAGRAPRPPHLRRLSLLVVGDDGAVRLRRQALLMPGGEAAGHAVGVEADRAVGACDHAGAHAAAAHEGHGTCAVERRRSRSDTLDLDVTRAGSMSRVPLVLLADVDDVEVARPPGGGGLPTGSRSSDGSANRFSPIGFTPGRRASRGCRRPWPARPRARARARRRSR